MEFQHLTDFTTDSEGMVLLERDILDLPIIFIYNEVEKYNLGYIRWHFHPEMEFTVVGDNPVEFYIGDRRIILRKDEGIWINSNEMHMVRCPEGISHAALYTVLLMPEFLAQKTDSIYRKYVQPWIQDPELSYVLFLESIDWHRQVIQALTSAFKMSKQQEFGYELSIRNEISKIWMKMIQHQKEIPKQISSRTTLHSQMRIRTMVNYIQEHCAERLTLTQIADSAHVSRSECIRCFKKNLNVTPIQYLNEYRLENAAELLISSAESINRIAGRCGFEDLSYFGKLFRAAHGVSPSQYRRINGKDAGKGAGGDVRSGRRTLNTGGEETGEKQETRDG